MKMIKQYIKRAANVVSLLVLVSIAGCGASDTKTFSIKEGVQGFSFEYPSIYSLVSLDLSNTSDSAYTTVGLGARTGDAISEIYIYVWPAGAGFSTAAETVDTLLTNAQGVLSDFALDKKTAATVDGQIAAGAAFTAVDTGVSTANPSGQAFYRVTCYLHNGLIVEIDMTCDVSLKASTQAQYDKLLQTFAALD